MATREHHTQRVRNIAVVGLYEALIGAYLLTFGIPKGCWRAPVKWWRASLPTQRLQMPRRPAPRLTTAWLALNGAWYGLCQMHGNEPWHFEYLPDAVAYGSPPMYPDPTWDPRMNPA